MRKEGGGYSGILENLRSKKRMRGKKGGWLGKPLARPMEIPEPLEPRMTRQKKPEKARRHFLIDLVGRNSRRGLPAGFANQMVREKVQFLEETTGGKNILSDEEMTSAETVEERAASQGTTTGRNVC